MIDVTKTITSVVEGAVDIGMVKWDEKAIAANAASTRGAPFKGAVDISRLAITIGGYAAWALGKGKVAVIGEAAALSTTPLLIHSIYNAMQKPSVAPVVREYVQRRVANPVPAGRTYEPELKKAYAM
ncbi:MAG: hypothetical protein PHI12_08555 [Dehalococcoidales bacterium]|nr:hypothetical protein [Dehalococcoidales bacterium]